YAMAPGTSPTYPLPLHDALPIFDLVASPGGARPGDTCRPRGDPVTNLDPNPELLDINSPNTTDGLSPGFEEKLGTDYIVEVLERSEEHTSELQSRFDLVCRLLLE